MSNRKLIRQRIRHLRRGYMVCSPALLYYTANTAALAQYGQRLRIEGRI